MGEQSFSAALADVADEQRGDIKELQKENEKYRQALTQIAFSGYSSSACWAVAKIALTEYDERFEIDPETGLDATAAAHLKRTTEGSDLQDP